MSRRDARAMRASQDRQDATKMLLRPTLARLAAAGRAALEFPDAAEDARARGRARQNARRRKYRGPKTCCGIYKAKFGSPCHAAERACEPRPVCRSMRSGRSEPRAPPPRGRSWSCGGCSTKGATHRTTGLAVLNCKAFRQRRLVAVATASPGPRRWLPRAAAGGAAAVWIRGHHDRGAPHLHNASRSASMAPPNLVDARR